MFADLCVHACLQASCSAFQVLSHGVRGHAAVVGSSKYLPWDGACAIRCRDRGACEWPVRIDSEFKAFKAFVEINALCYFGDFTAFKDCGDKDFGS